MFDYFKIPPSSTLITSLVVALLPLAGNLAAAEEPAAPPTPSRWLLGKGLTTEWLVNKDTRKRNSRKRRPVFVSESL